MANSRQAHFIVPVLLCLDSGEKGQLSVLVDSGTTTNCIDRASLKS